MPTSIGGFLCTILPWHRWCFVRRLSEWSYLDRCEHCGREWATNDNVMATLPYHRVASFYAAKASCNH